MKNERIPKFSKNSDSNKGCVFQCNTCDICKEFIANYYKNTAILRDDDELLYIPKVMY